MKRVLVIGSGGAGKSTISRELGQQLELEVLHLDKFYWRSGWQEPPKEAWQQTVNELIHRDSWIMDGNYSGTLAPRIQACDTIIFLDLSKLLCVWRIVKRRLLYRKASRPDMAEGCKERFSLEFIQWVLNYSRRSRPKVVKLIQEHESIKNVIWLRSRKEVQSFLNKVNNTEPSNGRS